MAVQAVSLTEVEPLSEEESTKEEGSTKKVERLTEGFLTDQTDTITTDMLEILKKDAEPRSLRIVKDVDRNVSMYAASKRMKKQDVVNAAIIFFLQHEKAWIMR